MTQANYCEDFLYNLSLMLAVSMTFEAAKEGAEGCWYVLGTDPPAQGTQESTADILKAYTANFPGLMESINSQLLPTAQAELGVQQATSTPSTQLALDLYKAFGPQFAQAGSNIDAQNKLNASNADLAVLQGPGKELALAAEAIRSAANPEEEAARKGIQTGISSLVSGLDPNALSGSERAEVERSINRDNAQGGNLAGGINTVSNAMGFGNALSDKQGKISSILANASGALGGSSTGFDPVQTALGRPSTSAGEGQFAGVSQNTGQNAFSLGSDFLGSLTSLKNQEQQINSQRRDPLDRINETQSAVGSWLSL